MLGETIFCKVKLGKKDFKRKTKREGKKKKRGKGTRMKRHWLKLHNFNKRKRGKEHEKNIE
jgi:hypothetical protein